MKKLVLAALTVAAVSMSLPSIAQDTAIDVALTDVSLNKVAFLVAGDNGLYKKYGLNIHQFITKRAADRISHSGIKVLPEFIGTNDQSRNAPIAVGGGSPFIIRMTTSKPEVREDRVIVATTDSEARFHIISSKALNSADDLKGKRLGYSSFGSVSHLMALEFLRQKGWTQGKDITLVGEGMDYSRLKKGEIDAFIGSEIYYSMAEKNGAKDLVNLADYNFPIAGSGINVDREWLKTHHKETENFLRAMIDSYALMHKNRSVVEAVLKKWYGITNPQQVDSMYAQIGSTPRKPYPAVDGIKLVKQLYSNPILNSHEASYFYDDSFIKDLDTSGFIDQAYKTQ